MPYYEDDLNIGNFAPGTIKVYRHLDDSLSTDPYDRVSDFTGSPVTYQPGYVPQAPEPDPFFMPPPAVDPGHVTNMDDSKSGEIFGWTPPDLSVPGFVLPDLSIGSWTPPDLSVNPGDVIGTIFPPANVLVEGTKKAAPAVAGIAGVLPIMILMMLMKK